MRPFRGKFSGRRASPAGGDVKRSPFVSNLKVRPTIFHDELVATQTAYSGKVVLSESILSKLLDQGVDPPYFFELRNLANSQSCFCGVQQFTGDEGFVYVPLWMMDQLKIEQERNVMIRSVTIPKASYVKLQAQSCEYLDMSDPRKVLEDHLVGFQCLSVGTTFPILHDGMEHSFKVTALRPSGAVSLIDTDVNLEFDEPVGWKEKQEERKLAMEQQKKKKEEVLKIIQDMKKRKKEDEKKEVEGESEPSTPKKVWFSSGCARRAGGQTIHGKNSQVPLLTPPSSSRVSSRSTSPSLSPSVRSVISDSDAKKEESIKKKEEDKDSANLVLKEYRYFKNNIFIMADSIILRIVTLGQSGCGKTQIISRYQFNTFDKSMTSTIGVEFFSRKLTLKGKSVVAHIHDTGGQEVFKSIARQYMRDARGALLVYDITNRQSFEEVEFWAGELSRHAIFDVAVVLIGNKSDLSHIRAVSTDEGEEMARRYGYGFLETSALNGENVKKAFESLYDMLAEKIIDGPETPGLDPSHGAGMGDIHDSVPIDVSPSTTGLRRLPDPTAGKKEEIESLEKQIKELEDKQKEGDETVSEEEVAKLKEELQHQKQFLSANSKHQKPKDTMGTFINLGLTFGFNRLYNFLRGSTIVFKLPRGFIKEGFLAQILGGKNNPPGSVGIIISVQIIHKLFVQRIVNAFYPLPERFKPRGFKEQMQMAMQNAGQMPQGMPM
ncbi:putative multi-domain containing protein [Aduncisulcus paluster]|uniref:Multi-domain containing protein n=1 Tax=Aduncisulcus paluster TaxID=2918883 RepID=A0ABQ5KRC6_9EUKA|nr:putative multi-domain containing protein [Aduncisulcus paluster]